MMHIQKVILFVWAAVLAAGPLFSSATAVAGEVTRLPVIHQVGSIPPRFEGDLDDSALKKRFTSAFYSSVRNSRRFRTLDDDLVSGMWATQKGRAELVTQFELHAFASLNIVSRGDTTTLTARLMSPDLTIWLMESDNVATGSLVTRSEAELGSLIENLIFRLFNRIPADVSVTSVQGTFLTISGGEEQAVRLDDEITLMRVVISSRHPANNSWLTFHERTLAKAKIVEVKRYTSVAKLTSMIKEGAVEVGDGAKVPAISGRAKFARLNEKPVFADAGQGGTVIVPPLYQEGVPHPKSKEAQSGGTAPQSHPAGGIPPLTQPSTQHQVSQDQAGNDGSLPPAQVNTPPETGGDGFNFSNLTKNLVEEVTIRFGAHTWDVSGPVSTDGKFPLWLINRLGFDVKRSLLMNIKLGFGGGIGFGQTTKGKYVGYDANGRIYWEQTIDGLGPILTSWRAGGEGLLAGQTVTDERFGGRDFVQGGGFGGLTGQIEFGESGEAYEWFSELAILPLNVGRFGYDGVQRSIESSFGWDFRLGGYRRSGAPRGEVEWGALTNFGATKITLNNGRRPQENHFSLMGLARYRF